MHYATSPPTTSTRALRAESMQVVLICDEFLHAVSKVNAQDNVSLRASATVAGNCAPGVRRARCNRALDT